MLAQSDDKSFIFYKMTADDVVVFKTKVNKIFDIRDFKIWGDSLYFCGKHGANYGFVASANINDFFSVSASELFYYKDIPESDCLTKMKIYEQGDVYLACIGTQVYNYYTPEPDAVVMLYNTNTDEYYIDNITNQYNILGHYEKEDLRDIEVNSQYIYTISNYDTIWYTPTYYTYYSDDDPNTPIVDSNIVIGHTGQAKHYIKLRRYDQANPSNTPYTITYMIDTTQFKRTNENYLFLTKEKDSHIIFVFSAKDINTDENYAFINVVYPNNLYTDISIPTNPSKLDYQTLLDYTMVVDMEYNSDDGFLYLLSTIKTNNTIYEQKIHYVDIFGGNTAVRYIQPSFMPHLNDIKIYNNSYLASVGFAGNNLLRTWNQKLLTNGCFNVGTDYRNSVNITASPSVNGNPLQIFVAKKHYYKVKSKKMSYTTICIQ
ncbi:MAG: hypothetical protein IJ180_02130 [Bacteroidales bacterium]|nr:hypothetical protein [Bacteroidales bacterium]